MENLEEDSSILSEFGLSNLQAKVYLSLAKSRSLKASEISLLSRVARPDVYRVLMQLEEAGLVEAIISQPLEYRAVPIEKCVSALMQKRIIKTAELQEKALRLTQCYKRDCGKEELDEKFQFMLIANIDAVYAKAEKNAKKAQERICYLASKRRIITWLLNNVSILGEALERKVQLQIILPKVDESNWLKNFEAISKYPDFELRVISQPTNVGFGVWDKNEIMINTLAVDTTLPHPALWSNNKSIVEVVQGYFDCIWQKSQKVDLCRISMAVVE